jgi:hypothetical protein
MAHDEALDYNMIGQLLDTPEFRSLGVDDQATHISGAMVELGGACDVTKIVQALRARQAIGLVRVRGHTFFFPTVFRL